MEVHDERKHRVMRYLSAAGLSCGRRCDLFEPRVPHFLPRRQVERDALRATYGPHLLVRAQVKVLMRSTIDGFTLWETEESFNPANERPASCRTAHR